MYSALDLSGKYLTYRSCFSSNRLTMSGSSDERRSLFLTSGVSPPQPSAGSLTQKKKTWGSRLYYYKLSILIVMRFIHEQWRIQGRGSSSPPPPPYSPYLKVQTRHWWAPGLDDQGNPIPRIDLNKLIEWLIGRSAREICFNQKK